jgi:hypothetical protein
MTAVVDIAGSIILEGVREVAKLIREARDAEALDKLAKMERQSEGYAALVTVYKNAWDKETARADTATRERSEMSSKLSDAVEVKEKLARELSALQAEYDALKKLFIKED